MFDLMNEKKLDAVVILSDTDRYYFTGFESSFGCVILSASQKVFITDFRYESAARAAVTDFELVTVTAGNLYSTVAAYLAKIGAKNVGYEDEYLSVAEFKRLKTALDGFSLKPASALIATKRLIKSADEISCISTAQAIAEKALTKILPLIKPGVTERDVAAELMFEMLRGGSEGAAFETIVAFGENAACPHHKVSDKKLEKNELILIDFGAKYRGYCSDMTRTFCLGEPNAELKSVYSAVLDAQKYALKNIRAGMTGREADSLAREFLRANGYGKEFGHSLGHGVGLQIHEQPRLGENNDTVLEAGMVVTVEPGVYIDGLGGVRIEDMIVIEQDGNLNLTHFNKNLNI